ncbi:HNH endonuclease [Natrinema versiforme]|uniref:HNH endonuclease n=1 Tax=Natrinema versiforme JCM 10478 TaxID=1227496 RepID=L9Y879_9EURY|nr:HNH endonuclease [Natrinema versiforme]ELY70254.1 HNH endonuclease [Natrinema versiforme JCM 10478]
MDCPTCGKSLSTEQGMRQHHTKVHGDPLPNRTCSGCGTEFYDPKARLEFCDECNPNGGTHNGNWKGGKETASCTCCGARFEYYPSDKQGVYCSDCIDDAQGLLPDNPSTKGERVVVGCEACGADLEVRPARLDEQERGFFCTLDCYGDWLSEHVVGPAHHQWDGGPIDYGRTWWRIRRQALERDEYECQHCGAEKATLGRNPDVHHVRPVRSFDDPEAAHTMANVVTLCRPCHRRAEDGQIAVSPRDEK